MTTTPSTIGAQHHILGSMRNADLRNALLEMLSLLIRDKDKAWRKQTEKQLLKIFNQWKTAHGSPTPMTYRGSSVFGQPIPISFEEATPYECAGVLDYVSFYFVLSRDKYAPLAVLTEIEDIPDLLAVAAMIEPEMTCLDSLLKTIKISLAATVRKHDGLGARNTYLVELMGKMSPLVKRGVNAQRQIADIQPKGAIGNAQKADKRRADIRKWAVDHFNQDNFSSYDECAQFLISKGVKGTPRTIKTLISGCKKIAVQKARGNMSNKL